MFIYKRDEFYSSRLLLFFSLGLGWDKFYKDKRPESSHQHLWALRFESDKAKNLVSRHKMNKMQKLGQSVKVNKCFLRHSQKEKKKLTKQWSYFPSFHSEMRRAENTIRLWPRWVVCPIKGFYQTIIFQMRHMGHW